MSLLAPSPFSLASLPQARRRAREKARDAARRAEAEEEKRIVKERRGAEEELQA